MTARAALAVCLGLVFAAGPTASRADADTEIADGVEVGFLGQTHLGRWTAVRFDGEGPERLRAADPLGNVVTYPTQTEAGRTRGLVRLGSDRGRLTDADGRVIAILRPAGDEPAASGAQVVVHPASTTLWAEVTARSTEADAADDVVVRDLRAAVAELQAKPKNGVRVELVEVPPNRFPAEPDALAELGYLLWHAPPPTESASAAALEWVRSGGRLAVAMSGDAAWADNPLITQLPVAIESRRYVQLDSLQRIAPNARRINLPRGVAVDGWSITQEGDGIRDADGLVVTVPLGFGSVTLCGVGLDAPAIRRWNGLADLHYRLAGRRPASNLQQRRAIRTVTRTGVNDLSTQIAAEVDRITAGDRDSVSNWSVLGYVAAYAILIGLVDYLLVHRLLRRPILTWITMPLLVAGGLLFADRLVGRQSAVAMTEDSPAPAAVTRPDRPIAARQFDLYDIDAGPNAVPNVASGPAFRTRRLELASLHVESLGRYDLRPQPWPKDATLRVGWFTPLESGFGGLYHAGGVGLRSVSYEAADSLDGLVGYPMEQRGGTLVESRSEGTLAGDRLQIDLARRGRSIVGTIEHDLGGELVDWFVALDRNLVAPTKPVPIRSNEPFGVDATTTRLRGLRDTLIGLRLEARASELTTTNKNVTERTTATSDKYDPLSGDLARAVRIASFFDVVGGTEYAGIPSHLPYDLDLSELLPLGRAVLFGRLVADPPPIRTVTADGEEATIPTARSDVFVRIVLPLAPDPGGGSDSLGDLDEQLRLD